MSLNADQQRQIPFDSLLFGLAPMLPFIAAAIGAWTLSANLQQIAIDLAILWGAMILAFVAGVRRGFGFGSRTASTNAAIGSMLAYFVPAGTGLLLFWAGGRTASLAILAIGYLLVAFLDRRASISGDAPAYFRSLRPVQMTISVASLLCLLARIVAQS